MTIQKNSRQIPKTIDITKQKHYSDILYGYLQTNSIRDEETGMRYVLKANAKKVDLAAALGVSRQTITTRYNKLMELGLIKDTAKRVELVEMAPNKAFLIPQETLRKLVNALNERSITIYVYLFNRYIANKENPYEFTITALKTHCGLGVSSNSNNYIINDILEVLETLGLIKYHYETKRIEGTTKTVYILDDIGYYICKKSESTLN